MFGKQAKYFRKAGGHVVEVGHPLLDLVEYKITRQQVYCLLACLWLFSVIQEMVLASQAMITLSLCYWCLSPSLQTSPSFTFHVLSPPLDTLPTLLLWCYWVAYCSICHWCFSGHMKLSVWTLFDCYRDAYLQGFWWMHVWWYACLFGLCRQGYCLELEKRIWWCC